MATTFQRKKMERWEGREHEAYPDPLTKYDPVKKGKPWTIGIGHTGPEVHEGLYWDDPMIDSAFDKDWAVAEEGVLDHLSWTRQLDDARAFVLSSMAFQMGVEGLLGFEKTLAAVRDGHYSHAGEMMLQSKWAKQTPLRARAMADQMSTGEWQ